MAQITKKTTRGRGGDARQPPGAGEAARHEGRRMAAGRSDVGQLRMRHEQRREK